MSCTGKVHQLLSSVSSYTTFDKEDKDHKKHVKSKWDYEKTENNQIENKSNISTLSFLNYNFGSVTFNFMKTIPGLHSHSISNKQKKSLK